MSTRNSQPVHSKLSTCPLKLSLCPFKTLNITKPHPPKSFKFEPFKCFYAHEQTFWGTSSFEMICPEKWYYSTIWFFFFNPAQSLIWIIQSFNILSQQFALPQNPTKQSLFFVESSQGEFFQERWQQRQQQQQQQQQQRQQQQEEEEETKLVRSYLNFARNFPGSLLEVVLFWFRENSRENSRKNSPKNNRKNSLKNILSIKKYTMKINYLDKKNNLWNRRENNRQ